MTSDSDKTPKKKPAYVPIFLLYIISFAFAVFGPLAIEKMGLAWPKPIVFIAGALFLMAYGCRQSYNRGWEDRSKAGQSRQDRKRSSRRTLTNQLAATIRENEPEPKCPKCNAQATSTLEMGTTTYSCPICGHRGTGADG